MMLPNPVKIVEPWRYNSTQSVCVSGLTFWNRDMSSCPRGIKVQLLSRGNIPTYCGYHGDPHFVAWCPVPASLNDKDPRDIMLHMQGVDVMFPAMWSTGTLLTDNERSTWGMLPLNVVFPPRNPPSLWSRLRKLFT